MSARSSRLHALERSLKGPCKSRAKARALTVMRFEGGTAPVRPVHPARLPKDVEDQIAVVRGHATGKPSRGLLQLEQRLLQPEVVGPTSPVVQRYDHGATPSTPSLPAPAPASHAYALSAPVAASEFGGRYNVESFEDRSDVTVASPAVAAAPGVTASPCAEPAWESPQPDRMKRRNALSAEQQAFAASFERDIASMLGQPSPASSAENQQWDNAVRNAANAPTDTPPPPVVTSEPTATPKLQGHDVFNQMGLAMNYANSFDLGAMDLSARFDHFDDELSLASKSPPPAPSGSMAIPSQSSVQALALDDFDLVADLAEISGAQSVPAPGSAVATSEPCVPIETERMQS